MRRLGGHHKEGDSRGRMLSPTTTTDLSVNEAPTVTGPRRETNWQKRAHETERTNAEVMNLLRQIATSAGGILTIAKAAPTSDVLLQGTYTVGAGGIWTQSFSQPFASVLVGFAKGTTTGRLVVVSSPPGESPPALGAGVWVLHQGFWRIVPMRGSALTIYGPTPTAGPSTASFDVTVFVRPQPAAGGPC